MPPIELCFTLVSTAILQKFRPSDSCKELIDSASVGLPGMFDGATERQPRPFSFIWMAYGTLMRGLGITTGIHIISRCFEVRYVFSDSPLPFYFLPIILYVA
jgi:hypothetical protein